MKIETITDAKTVMRQFTAKGSSEKTPLANAAAQMLLLLRLNGEVTTAGCIMGAKMIADIARDELSGKV